MLSFLFTGYKIETLSSAGKKPFGMSLSHSDAPSLNLVANDQVDFTRWFMALEGASKSEAAAAVASTKQAELPVAMATKTEGVTKEKVSIFEQWQC